MTALASVRQTMTATHMLLVEWRREVGLVLGFTVFFPLGFLFFLNVLVAPSLRIQVLVGTIMLEMALLNINVLAQSMGQDKSSKMFDLWVSLPVSPAVYTFSNALAYLPFSMASALLTVGVAETVFGIALAWTLLVPLLAALLLVWLSTLGIGFLIGAFGRSPRQINSMAQLVGIILTFFTPVFYPVTILPSPLRTVAYAWPLTWGSQFLTGVLHGDGATVVTSGAVLSGFVVLWLLLIGLGVRWRAR